MKIIRLLSFLTVIIFSVGLHGMTPVTAEDITNHLGISFWKFDQSSLPKEFSAQIVEIKDGKIAGDYISRTIFQNPGDLVVAANNESDGLNVSMRIAGSATHVGSGKKKIGFSARAGSPKLIAGVPLVLAGDYRRDGDVTRITGKLEDVVSGIALIVEERSSKDH